MLITQKMFHVHYSKNVSCSLLKKMFHAHYSKSVSCSLLKKCFLLITQKILAIIAAISYRKIATI